MQPDSITSLIRQAHQGDSRALNELLARLRPLVLKRAQHDVDRRVAARLDASDIVQSTLLKVAEAFPNFHGTTEAELHRWVKTLTEHTVIDVARRHIQAEMRTILVEKPLEATRGSGAPLKEVVPDTQSSPSEHARRADECEHSKKLIGQLSLQDQEVVTLRLLKGFSFVQVAQALNVSEAAAAQRFGRAILRLRSLACSNEERP